MEHITPSDRFQITFGSLDELIAANDPVRFLDAFAEKLDLKKLGFQVKPVKTEGRPPFDPRLFLKIYLYGYQNGIRSSCRLEKECKRNIEMQWLCGRLVPNYHTKKRDGRASFQFKKYRTAACKTCPVKHLCTGKEKGGREIERSQYAEAVELNNKNYHHNQRLYRLRQEYYEHIFGTVKRKWGYYCDD